MQISDILSEEKTFNNIISNSKKRALEQSAHLLSQSLTYKEPDKEAGEKTLIKESGEESKNNVSGKKAALKTIDEFDVFNALIEREQLGSTSIGNGVAIPHCALDNITEASAVMLRLNEAVDFGAADNTPVDLLIVLAVPNKQCEHFKSMLTRLAQMLMNRFNLEKLRDSEDSESLYNTLLSFEQVLLLKDKHEKDKQSKNDKLNNEKIA